jgi:hypothetical protein
VAGAYKRGCESAGTIKCREFEDMSFFVEDSSPLIYSVH